MQGKKSSSKHKGISRKEARSAVRMARRTAGSKKHASKAWKKGGREYSRVLGHFGLTSSHTK